MAFSQQGTTKLKNLLIGCGAGILLLGYFAPPIVLIFVGFLVPASWRPALGESVLVVVGISCMFLGYRPLLWLLQHRVYQPLLLNLLSTSFLVAIFLVSGLHGVFESNLTWIVVFLNGMVFFFTLLLVLVRRWRLFLSSSGGRMSIEPEIRQALIRALGGWGMMPQEACQQGIKQLILGLVFGGFWIVEGVGLSVMLKFPPPDVAGWLYGSLGFLMVAGGIWLVTTRIFLGARLLRHWWAWRLSPNETIRLEGTLEGIWEQMSPLILQKKIIIKLHLSDNNSKLLVAKSSAIQGNVLAADERVYVDYLIHTEAVMHVVQLPQKEATRL